MCSGLRTLVLLPRVVVKVDALVVEEFDGGIVLLVLSTVLAALVVLLGARGGLLHIRTILEIAVLHCLLSLSSS